MAAASHPVRRLLRNRAGQMLSSRSKLSVRRARAQNWHVPGGRGSLGGSGRARDPAGVALPAPTDVPAGRHRPKHPAPPAARSSRHPLSRRSTVADGWERMPGRRPSMAGSPCLPTGIPTLADRALRGLPRGPRRIRSRAHRRLTRPGLVTRTRHQEETSSSVAEWLILWAARPNMPQWVAYSPHEPVCGWSNRMLCVRWSSVGECRSGPEGSSEPGPGLNLGRRGGRGRRRGRVSSARPCARRRPRTRAPRPGRGRQGPPPPS